MNLTKSLVFPAVLLVAGLFLLAGCVTRPVAIVDLTPPVVHNGTVVIKSACDTIAVDVETGKEKWRIKNTESRKFDFCEEEDK